MRLNWARIGSPLFAATAVFSSDSSLQNDIPENRIQKSKTSLDDKVVRANDVINRWMVQNSIPGLSVGVSVDGNVIWKSGFGYSNVEQGTLTHGDTVMRIASISKPITACIAQKLVQEGKLDLDKPIHEYIKDYPAKTYENEPVQITTRQLLCHMGGIRHYKNLKDKASEKKESNDQPQSDASKDEKEKSKKSDVAEAPLDTVYEQLSRKPYKNVTEALEMFKNDPLENKPGSKYLYTTHGFTLASAVLEKAAEKEFHLLVRDLYRQLGMNHSYLDFNSNIMPHRAKYYYRDPKHRLHNSPEVDNSYKWAGGGLVSCVPDLLKFANVMLYSYQSTSDALPKSFLEKKVVDEFWRPHVDTIYKDLPTKYCLGWMYVSPEELYGGIESNRSGFWFHTGAAVGACSVLLVRPNRHLTTGSELPQGVCVAILINIQECAAEITQLALELSEIFSDP